MLHVLLNNIIWVSATPHDSWNVGFVRETTVIANVYPFCLKYWSNAQFKSTLLIRFVNINFKVNLTDYNK